MWFYDIESNLWVVEEKQLAALNRIGWSSAYDYGNFLLFGGLG